VKPARDFGNRTPSPVFAMGGRFGKGDAGVTMEEVERHNSREDAWIVLFGEAIDVTKFLPLHPGGDDMLAAYLGKDATKDWQMIHEADTLDRYQQHLTKLGKVSRDGILTWLWKRSLRYPESGASADADNDEVANVVASKAKEEREPVRWTAEHESELPPGGLFDLQELSRWDGVQLPMCVSVCGIVVDVSSSENFTPDFGYGKLWAGKDTTWAMATVSLKAHDANRLDFKLDDLDKMQFEALAGWYKHFLHKYRKVGTLREFRDWDFSAVEEAAKKLPTSSLSEKKESQVASF